MTDLILVSDDASSNSLGRVFCLWLLAEQAGLNSVVVAPSADRVWGPLDRTRFSERIVSHRDFDAAATIQSGNSIIICVKLLPSSVGLAMQLQRSTGFRVLFDVDDPDFEAGTGEGNPLRRVALAVLRRARTRDFKSLEHWVTGNVVTVSSPTLNRRWGGAVIPHVRHPVPENSLAFGDRASRAHGDPLTVSFTGTARKHKGINNLRRSVNALQGTGYRLQVTDAPPADARPWESWVGNTTLDAGLELTAKSDIVAIPSISSTFSRGQLPAKLIDAMMLGMPIVASDLPPIRWALGDSGRLVRPGSVNDLTKALLELRDPALRMSMGVAARTRFAATMSVEANAGRFVSALDMFRTSRA